MGKGSSKGHTPREAKDNLKSTQLLSVIDAISEGPIEGPVNSLKSVLLNSTPVLDSEGNTNISGVTVVFRAGEQEQTPPEGFESSGSETVLGTEVKYDTPITRTITSANIDRLRFTFGVQALVETTSKGDRNPSEVRLLVQIQRNGGWVTEKDITIKGKTTSQYLASVVVGNLPPRPFNIRMRRMTPDSTTDQLQNKTLWSSYTEIIDVKQCYPNTALVGVQVDSEQFGSQQVSRNYHLRGRILQVPSNYNPQTRQYSGIWDGTFKPAYSNNMAWCLWDMLTHPRYGMGKRLGAADVDKWALYVIGQCCDQSVPDGFGGTEPRITCNAWLTTQRKAWDVLSDFCSAMRCMPVWNGQTLTFVQDRPSDKVWTYNRSNVVMPDDGAPFRYSFSVLKDRHNAVEVNWIDPNNGWETATELVEDTQAIVRYGRNVTKMDAFGCTSRGQAHRAGLWLIKTELLETQTVDFSVGAEGLRHVPGDVIEICDDDYAGIRTGGRVLAVNSQTRTLTLDRENIFWGINTLFGPFVLDLFTDGDNAKCAAYYTAEDNALAHDWSERLAELKGAAFGNPPYSRASQHEGQYITGMRYIMKHASAMRDKGGRYVFLIKAATSEVWWPEDADHIAFIRGRIGFELPAWFIPKDEKQVPTGAFFAGAIAVFDKTWKGPAISYIGRDELEACGEAFLAQVRLQAEKLVREMAA